LIQISIQNTMTTLTQTEAELDLAISNMDSEDREEQAKSILSGMPGVLSAHLHERGALIRYQTANITQNIICEHLRAAGFDVTVFQDSATGTTGSVEY
jgi:hypothetical protein